ncbi:hypothetical protein F1880_002402 [Penicillium rolfsii]|nr:hypothetical protein F1880_002402 [Penicillium rolfsii]
MDQILPPGPTPVTRSERESLLSSLRERKSSKQSTDDQTEPEFKPQAKRRKSCRGPGPQIPREALSLERARHLERNRLAANKCRLKKKKQHEQIQDFLKDETARRDILLAEVDVLKEELWCLKNCVFEHANCNDQHISSQLSKMNQDLLEQNLRRRSSSSFSDSVSSGRSEEGAMPCLYECTSLPEWGDFSEALPVYDQDSCGGYFDEVLNNFVDVTQM